MPFTKQFAMHLIFLMSVFSTIVYSVGCFNPYLRESYMDDTDQNMEYSDRDRDAASFDTHLHNAAEDERNGDEGHGDDLQVASVLRKRSVDAKMSRLGELNKMNDNDIAAALSRLSVDELDTLDRFIDEKAQANGGFAAKGALSKRCGVSHKHDNPIKTHPRQSHKSKRMVGQSGYFRRSRVSRLTPQQRVDAKINFMREKYKRQSALQRIEESRRLNQQEKRDQSKREFQLNDNSRNPYYNSLTGPRARAKRSSDQTKGDTLDTMNPMDDPKSVEHLRLLQDSFPNPSETESRAENGAQSLVRVKRS